MSTFVLKLIALTAMLIDHGAYAAQSAGYMKSAEIYRILRAIGRPAFPIFAFLLVKGFYKTSNRKRYLTRLFAFAAVSQLPFSMLTAGENYTAYVPSAFRFDLSGGLLLLIPAAAWLLLMCGGRPDRSLFWAVAALGLTRLQISAFGLKLLGDEYNVFYTLAFGMVLMLTADRVENRKLKPAEILLAGASIAVMLWKVQYCADYDFPGLMLIFGLYLCRNIRGKELYVLSAWCMIVYLAGAHSAVMTAFSLASVLAVLLYNGKRGKNMKYFFYAFYPVHILTLVLVFQVLLK